MRLRELADRPRIPQTPLEKSNRIAQLQAERGAEKRGERVSGHPARSFASIQKDSGDLPLEESRLAPLYHVMDTFKAKRVFLADQIEPHWFHDIPGRGGTKGTP